MTASPTPKSTASTGNLRSWWVPAGANPLSVAVLAGGTTKDVTFSFTGSGVTPNIDENKIPDSRFGSRQVFSKRGNFSEDLTLEYLFGDVGDIAQPTLTEGTSGFLVVRRAVANEVEAAAGQKVTVYAGDLGKQMQQPAAENALDTMKQNVYLTAPTQNLVALIA